MSENKVEKELHDPVDNEKVDVKDKKEKKNKQQEKINQLELEVKELKDKLLRNAADLDNYKKRTNTERINERKYAAMNFIHSMLDPIEQFTKIVDYKTDNDLLKNFLIGFKMISDQFVNMLEQEGVKEIEALNCVFDPTKHHAVEKVNNKELANGINVEVLQKGYTYKDRILRPAMVKVNEWSDENGENK